MIIVKGDHYFVMDGGREFSGYMIICTYVHMLGATSVKRWAGVDTYAKILHI